MLNKRLRLLATILLGLLSSVSAVTLSAAPQVSDYTSVPANTSRTLYTGAKPGMLPVVFSQATFNASTTSNNNASITSQAQFQLTINNNSGQKLYVLVSSVRGESGVSTCQLFSGQTGVHYVNSQVSSCTNSFMQGASQYYLYISNSAFTDTSPASSGFNYNGLPYGCTLQTGHALNRNNQNAPYTLLSLIHI